MNNLKTQTSKGIFWKIAENFGTAVVGFIVQIILARILFPEDYGILAITLVFINIANVFVTSGFTSAIIQKKELSELELSSIYYINLLISFVLFIIIIIFTPLISTFYNMPILKIILPVQSFILILSGFNSIYTTLLTRKLEFKKSFNFKILAVFVQGVVGILLAVYGFGIWALIISNYFNYFISTYFVRRYIRWRPTRQFSLKTALELFKFGKNILFLSLINIGYNSFKTLLIGRSYDSKTLGYFSKGEQIPNLLMVNTDGAINSVMFPVLSKSQDDPKKLIKIYSRGISLTTFLTFPMMLGLFILADSVILVLLTEKWANSIIYMQISTLICMTWPFSMRNQALNSVGKSHVSFKLDLLIKIITIILMIVSIKFGILYLLLANLLGSIIAIFIGFYVIKSEFDYSVYNQMKDVSGPLISSILMALLLRYVLGYIDGDIYRLLIGIPLGMIIYFCLSFAFNYYNMKYYLDNFVQFYRKLLRKGELK
ncbi:MAG: hypothetical protein A2Y45_00520 [Tenericutes bacterium GWC2_34_14]|nr:MAG: hypothetical protein A2Y45_00520 [Tenericutes bacterium GWC2_34_14]OHE35840.1 MAG: hypothetical protein A2Y46_02845 [Tenericutes bacterium GWF1_35_14]OHE39073.1 MAG: hypothetical protein A2Y44_07085 [Tenericutes bacterium GWF2_35_184]OHE42270.1 MAG: hypothetical protein A3K26_06985 [Tenericutes bacterium RIFOXYA12_FULL_35_10]OHE42860.1 MAG: hypothetical protein A2221_09150 [Tenericutes bacterium RIFOXYA2_FULL_36_32]OHE46088.1 MAG: hypothetical protein A2308_00820 [Tenericutes bacterium